MYATIIQKENTALVPLQYHCESRRLHRLTAEHKDEVLDFLAERPIHTFGLTGFIRSNGLESEHNRGAFYGIRGEDERFEGVALIGHHILFETNSESAIKAFARQAQRSQISTMLLGEQEKVETFWHHYNAGGRTMRLHCRELLLQQQWPAPVYPGIAGLRLATINDLHLIVPAHAQTVIDESGIDPLETDPEGFRQRCARRIEKGRTWLWVDEGKLIFKAEVVTDTPEVVYLEGVWTNPQERGRGYGSRCMSQLTRKFLERSDSVCILVNDRFKAAQAFYRKLGYQFVSSYDTIFLNQQ